MGHLKEILKLFLHLGFVAFGGPAAHIAMMHKEVVDKRKWMSDEHFLVLVGATSLIPGPNSTEMVLHCGFHKGGLRGLLVAGVSFILPACLITFILAYLYVLAFDIPHFEAYIIGIKPIVILLILQALKKLGSKAIKNYETALMALFAFALCFIDISEVYAIFIAAFIGFIILKLKNSYRLHSIGAFSLFLVFLKVGSVLFGSGYVLVSYLQDELVENRGWLTSSQLADAIAIGQFTPGPVLSTSTFVGHILGGGAGALAATLGIFLPSFLFVYLLNPLIPKLRNSKNFSELLNCINAAAVGIMAYAIVPLSMATFSGAITIVIFILGLILLLKRPSTSSISLVTLGLFSGAIFTFIKSSPF